VGTRMKEVVVSREEGVRTMEEVGGMTLGGGQAREE
jgi:hypothetical protein